MNDEHRKEYENMGFKIIDTQAGVTYPEAEEQIIIAQERGDLRARLEAAEVKLVEQAEVVKQLSDGLSVVNAQREAAEASAAETLLMLEEAAQKHLSNLSRIAELERELIISRENHIDANRRNIDANIRAAELERELESACVAFTTQQFQAVEDAKRERDEAQAQVRGLREALERLALLKEDIPDEMADNKFVFDVPVWLIRQVREDLASVLLAVPAVDPCLAALAYVRVLEDAIEAWQNDDDSKLYSAWAAVEAAKAKGGQK